MGKKSRHKKLFDQSAKPETLTEPEQGLLRQKRVRWHLIILSLILITGFFLRLYYINSDAKEKQQFFPGDGIGVGNTEMLGWDGVRYDWIATNVTEGKGYGYKAGQPDAWRPPGYPFFLIAVYSLFGKNYYTVRVIQVILSTLTILFSYLITTRIGGKSSGLGAALICALYHDAVVFPLLYYSETLFMFLISGLIYMLINFNISDNKPWTKWAYPAVVGTIGGYATLVRPIYLLGYPFLIAGVMWYYRCSALIIKKIVVMTIVMVLVLTPWCIRNSKIKGKPSFISTNGGLNLAMGFCENAKGYFIPEQQRFTPEEQAIIATQGYGAAVRQYILSNPLKSFGLYIKKIGIQMFKPGRRHNVVRFSNFSIPMLAYFPLTLMLFLGGLIASFFGRRHRFGVVYGYLAGYILMNAFFFYMGDRHRIPLLPVYAVFGGYLISVVYRIMRTRLAGR
jgi:4-amino-4-deoxy-L-arabinose transferase-like glycosyltransferase